MDTKKNVNHNLSIFGWGAMFVWWATVVTIDPITLGMGAMGTGLILLGVNTIRSLKGITLVRSTTDIGIALLTWGALDQARLMLGLSGGLSFALALFVIGISIWLIPFLHHSETLKPDET